MWIISSFFNIMLSIVSLGVLPFDHPEDGILQNKDSILAKIGLVAGGEWLQWWVAVDSFIVLAAAVLTANVGITGNVL